MPFKNPESKKEYDKSYRLNNRDKKAQENKRYRSIDPDKTKARSRRYHLKQKYGITEIQYEEILKSQNRVCAICNSECSTGNRLAVDHNHENGNVRGLLCYNCNTTLGKWDDNIQILERAIDYLKRNESWQ